MAKLKFAGIQINTIDAKTIQERDANLMHASQLINKLETVDLIVLPELFTCGYSRESFTNLNILAEDEKGKSFEVFSKIALERNCYICFGFPEKKDGKYYISQAVINPLGQLDVIYSKQHMAQFGNSMEKEFFERGDETISFEIKGIKIGIMICYDMRFPELSRKMALEHEIDFLLHPVAFSKDNSFPSWPHFVITRALENQIYLLSLNRAGEEYGNSQFCPPWIDYNTSPTILKDKEDIIIGEIDTDIIHKVREEYRFREDRKSSY
ncbi:carbon-nitrogen hydrolase family protein [Labilibaculum sp. DW002]|uniref:Carbon-nitrogen hydrolase family protein n=1 Tax=Paralabilibaculum antarcticum TaxID=2912572 RepID=A0ABT5VTJ4_9BACT|nr:carbon-nitrogen hydrolase family protein [Labilibaculum sp. DW002]MDE5418637.1 carbon-nitrogen hydrolase family protein [Labilibaculum sp. DW002]